MLFFFCLIACLICTNITEEITGKTELNKKGIFVRRIRMAPPQKCETDVYCILLLLSGNLYFDKLPSAALKIKLFHINFMIPQDKLHANKT